MNLCFRLTFKNTLLIACLVAMMASPSSAQTSNTGNGTSGPIVLSQTSPNGDVTELKYYDNHLEKVFQDARGVTTRTKLNSLGQMVFESAPESGTKQFSYDEFGRPVGQVLEGGLNSKRFYDENGRVNREVWREDGQDKIVTRYSYDNCENGQGQLCRVRHNGHVTLYHYTENNTLSKVRIKLADEDTTEVLRYNYRTDGRLRTMRYPSGLAVRYHYDEDGLLSSLTGHYESGENRDRFVIVKNISYDDETGQLASFVHGNGIRTIARRGPDGSFKQIELKKYGVSIDKAIYTWNDEGHLAAIDRLDTSNSQSFEYDTQGRLIGETSGDGTSSNTSIISYSYDSVGNRLTRTDSGHTRNYSYAQNSNRLISTGNQSLEYDDRGNLIADRDGKRQFEYDSTNRMIAFRKNGVLRATYDYDSHGRRIRKTLIQPDTDNTKSVRFIYNTDGQLISETSRREDRSALRAKDLVWLGTMPVAQIERRVNSNGSTENARISYLHTDHLGAVRSARDAEGTIVWQWQGDSFGARTRNAPAVDRDPDGDGVSSEISLRFPGQYHDRESGLFYNHHRDYDPKLGRYIQSDPVGLHGGINRYAYVGSNPVKYSDPSGLLYSCTTTAIWANDGWVPGSDITTCIWIGPNTLGATIDFDMSAANSWYAATVGGFCNASGCTAVGVITTPGNPQVNQQLYTYFDPYYNPELGEYQLTDANLFYGSHEYEWDEDSTCSAQDLFEAIRQPGLSAPGAPYALQGTHSVILFGGNPVTQTVDTQNLTIVNQTQQGHIFHSGSVLISVESTPNGSRISLTGVGTGLVPWFNDAFGLVYFSSALEQAAYICHAI